MNSQSQSLWRVWLQNQWQSSWGRALAQLELIGRASANRGRFLVCCSSSGQRPARFGKNCCHPCYANSFLNQRSIFRSIICLRVKIRQRNKTACYKSNLVQSSRSKSTTQTCMIKIKSYVVIAFSYRKANILRKWSKILHFCYGNKGLCHGCRSQWFGWKLALLHAASEQLRY